MDRWIDLSIYRSIDLIGFSGSLPWSQLLQSGAERGWQFLRRPPAAPSPIAGFRPARPVQGDGGMTPEQLQQRTFEFALRVFRFVRPLLREPETRHPAHQALRSASSVAANYRAACLARTPAEWLAKIGLVREEADESLFWLQFIHRAELSRSPALDELVREAGELTRIFAASYRTSHDRLRSRRTATNRSMDR